MYTVQCAMNSVLHYAYHVLFCIVYFVLCWTQCIRISEPINISVLCLSCFFSINVKTTRPIGPQFFWEITRPREDLWMVRIKKFCLEKLNFLKITKKNRYIRKFVCLLSFDKFRGENSVDKLKFKNEKGRIFQYFNQ